MDLVALLTKYKYFCLQSIPVIPDVVRLSVSQNVENKVVDDRMTG